MKPNRYYFWPLAVLAALFSCGFLGCGGGTSSPNMPAPLPPPGARLTGLGFPQASPWMSDYGPAATLGDLDKAAQAFRIINIDADPDIGNFTPAQIVQLKADGSFVRQWGATGKIGIWAGQFNYLTDVALGADGTLYVADGYNDRIQAFDSSGNFLRKWGGPFAMNIFGPFNGWFATVTRVTVDKSGNVFVADFYNHRIQKFTSDGEFLTGFGTKGQGPSQFNHAIAVAVAGDGTVFVADFGNNRIETWRQTK